jgi:hypothetical protein
VPGPTLNEYARSAGNIAALYEKLLGMTRRTD